MPSSGPHPPARDRGSPGVARLSRELAGDLPCIQCGYNLRGLTVRGMCPECGTGVRATLLAVVDPMAGEFRPIAFPRLTAYGMLVWSHAAVASVLLAWGMLVMGTQRSNSVLMGQALHAMGWGAVVLLGVSALGSLVLVRPHAGISGWGVACALVGVLGYVPLIFGVYSVLVRMDPGAASAFDSASAPERVPLRLGASACMVVILLCLRPNARALQARWLLLRTGAVARQTMLTLAAVVLIWCLGDALLLFADRFYGGLDDALRVIGKLLILVGALLYTIGLYSVAMDCWRIHRVILRPPVVLEQLLAAPPDAPLPRGAGEPP